jgi:hypothetical protein
MLKWHESIAESVGHKPEERARSRSAGSKPSRQAPMPHATRRRQQPVNRTESWAKGQESHPGEKTRPFQTWPRA